ncbi:MAG: sulfite exporter TauE/SafE family protein [Anaerolineae bacterium]|nr:sulfite exporter TauE/SafE family protein [Anaerolineae bacterium]
MLDITLVGVIFFAATLQTLVGFGFALLVMPLLTLVLGIKTAAPLVALVGFTLYLVNLLRYRRGLVWRETLQLLLPALVGVLVGVQVLRTFDENLIKGVLGVVLIGYALFALFKPALPPLKSTVWAYPVGFLAGCLGGAFNTPGPPIIVYGNARVWPRDQFRSTLQVIFLASSATVILAHAAAGNITADVARMAAIALPALLAGIALGAFIDRRMSHERFRTAVLVLIMATGVLMLV